ncbi:MAG TPA: 4-hydroxy-tetrahydrodipicolinate reductase [Candidatus Hydrogenedentes bacterium]|nr:MAG: 4-hydroxy-tetrahydrodipicolinate reductase [Candidatus Hydrogenedentes bacterium ADurb.Bin170]HOM49263.1 4-hydroxy-tetrahydrodipicolinate reductase [Candidatus Hydrogenedentota bacterium]HOR51778.1 4-hydroxy-tetrahydrodipicolinate reductase [Candidatus Hydrogenedentota bacterium]HPX87377.1 4-hydroxy-tetrahydrodipicolinate reductase [Candidatus Hydrogenedentota bacterium]HQB03458.1 4-hydroxy-tetrahydrodipicolinate reductase [Candidatus Hydrogenedentota bacterium]
MITICMAGACGRMGRRILELTSGIENMAAGSALDLPALAGTEIAVTLSNGKEERLVVGADSRAEIGKAQVLIDFTAPAACLEHVAVAEAMKKPAVVGTTGLSAEQVEALKRFAQNIPVVYAPNMSVGVNLLFKLTEEVARRLGLAYNVEIVEAHHNLKKDSPSGTAVRLAEQAARGLGLSYPEEAVFGREGIIGARPERQIGVHAIRGGDIVGEHTVSFIGCGERIELTHKAHNRDNFARGALIAAKFVATAAPGLYDMQAVLGLD